MNSRIVTLVIVHSVSERDTHSQRLESVVNLGSTSLAMFMSTVHRSRVLLRVEGLSGTAFPSCARVIVYCRC